MAHMVHRMIQETIRIIVEAPSSPPRSTDGAATRLPERYRESANIQPLAG
jgi:hypothetical protein